MKWSKWLGEQSGKKEWSEDSDKLRKELKSKYGIDLPEGALISDQSHAVAMEIGPKSTEEDVARELVKCLKDMTRTVTDDVAGKFKLNKAKIKAIVAEQYYQQATAPTTFEAKNFGDSKLVQ